jgi:hypothetical protein
MCVCVCMCVCHVGGISPPPYAGVSDHSLGFGNLARLFGTGVLTVEFDAGLRKPQILLSFGIGLEFLFLTREVWKTSVRAWNFSLDLRSDSSTYRMAYLLAVR